MHHQKFSRQSLNQDVMRKSTTALDEFDTNKNQPPSFSQFNKVARQQLAKEFCLISVMEQ